MWWETENRALRDTILHSMIVKLNIIYIVIDFLFIASVTILSYMDRRFEIILAMEGESLSTSCISMTTASYLSKEILWGHRFKNCVTYNEDRQSYVVDHKAFNKTEEVITPLCSAKRLVEVMAEIQGYCYDISSESPILNEDKSIKLEDKDSGRHTLSPIIVHRVNMEEKSDSDSLEGTQIGDTNSSDSAISNGDNENNDCTGDNCSLYKSLALFLDQNEMTKASSEDKCQFNKLLETSL